MSGKRNYRRERHPPEGYYYQRGEETWDYVNPVELTIMYDAVINAIGREDIQELQGLVMQAYFAVYNTPAQDKVARALSVALRIILHELFGMDSLQIILYPGESWRAD